MSQKISELPKVTPDFDDVIKVVFWNGLGFIFFNFLKTFAVIYYFGGTGFDLGVIFAIQPLARLFVTPLIGYLTDKTSKKRLIYIGSVGRAISYIIYYISLCISNLMLFGLGIIVQGLLVGFYWNPYTALIAEKSYKHNRTEAIGKGRGMQVGKGYLLGALISFSIFGPTSIFLPTLYPLMFSPMLIFALVNIVTGSIFYKNVDEKLTYDVYLQSIYKDKPEIIKEHLSTSYSVPITPSNDMENNGRKNRSVGITIGFIVFLLVVLIYFTNGTLSTPFLKVYLTESILVNYYSLDNPLVPVLVLGLYFPADVISEMVSQKVGELSDKYKVSLSILMMFILRSTFTFLLILMDTPWGFSLILIFYHIFIVGNTYLMHSIISRISKKNRGQIFGLYELMRLIGSVIGPLLGAMLWVNLGQVIPYIISIFVVLILIPFFLLSVRLLKPFMSEQV